MKNDEETRTSNKDTSSLSYIMFDDVYETQRLECNREPCVCACLSVCTSAHAQLHVMTIKMPDDILSGCKY